jgi:glycosyltransferase involved in cell wall biosynthesis
VPRARSCCGCAHRAAGRLASLPGVNSEVQITACLAVHNEEAVIERCLRSLDGVVDEIVLVHDGECEDATLEIARRFGCRVFVRPHISPEHQRVFAYEQARGEWLFRIDADEFLSDELRAHLREVAADPEANGHRFAWPMWDGERYITENGAPRLVMFRRAKTHVLGVPEVSETVDPPIKNWPYVLEHRPLYNNFTREVITTKWRRRAQAHARAFVTDFDEIPKFNYRGPPRWSWRRRLINRLSPLLILPVAPIRFTYALIRHRSYYRLRENVRFAAYEAIYSSMLQYYLAKAVYLRRSRTQLASAG